KPRATGASGATYNEAVAPVRPLPEKIRVEEPARVSDRPLKVATPFTTGTVVVPLRTAPAGLLGASATLTLPPYPDTALPLASRTVTAAAKALPAGTEDGGAVVTASRAAVAVTLRMRLLSVSAMYRSPAASTATVSGSLR